MSCYIFPYFSLWKLPRLGAPWLGKPSLSALGPPDPAGAPDQLTLQGLDLGIFSRLRFFLFRLFREGIESIESHPQNPWNPEKMGRAKNPWKNPCQSYMFHVDLSWLKHVKKPSWNGDVWPIFNKCYIAPMNGDPGDPWDPMHPTINIHGIQPCFPARFQSPPPRYLFLARSTNKKNQDMGFFKDHQIIIVYVGFWTWRTCRKSRYKQVTIAQMLHV